LKGVKIIKLKKQNLIFLLILLISFIIFSNCGREYKSYKKNLIQYFSLFPVIKAKSRIILKKENFYSYILDGWSEPKKNLPFIWKSNPRSSFQIFFGKEKPEKMIIKCRANIPVNLRVLLNEKEISNIRISKGHNLYRITLPHNLIKEGLNTFSFITPSEVHNKKNTIAFHEINFSPVKKTQSSIIISLKKQSIKFHGTLLCYYFLRTYEHPEISFLIRALSNSFPENKLKIVIENFEGKKEIKEITLNSKKWQRKIINLSSFKNQLVKISFYHFGNEKNITEIKKPYFRDRFSIKKRKIILIGLDGATWKIIDPLIKKGKLPNLNKLINSGVRGNLRTVKPWYSPLIWTSIVTGKTKEKHGITGFISQRRRKGEIIPNSRLNRKCFTLWNILSYKGLVVGIAGPWVSWPAEKVNGYILTDRMFFENLPSTTFPPELKSLLFLKIKPEENKSRNSIYLSMMNILDSQKTIPRYSLKVNIKNEKLYLKQDNLKQYAGLYLNKIFNPDFFFLYMRGPDVTSHFFWKYFEPDSSVPEEEIKLYGELIPKNYIYQDYIVGKYISRADPNTTIIIVSDHGMDKKDYKPKIIFDNINKLWKKIGISDYLSVNKTELNSIEVLIKDSKKLKRIKNILSKLAIRKQKPIFQISVEKPGKILKLKLIKPYSLDYDSFIYIKDKKIGRLKEYIQIKEISGDHTLYGILIMKGKGIKKNYQIKNCSVLDITPTILYLLGLPVGKDMDGKVLKDAFTPEFLKKNPVKYINTYESLLKKEFFEKKYHERNKELEKKLIEQLKSLGYIK